MILIVTGNLMGVFMHKILIITSLFFISECFAYKAVDDYSSSIFSNLQVNKAQSNIELEIAKSKLQKLQIENEIDKLTSGVSKSNTTDIFLKEINIFNDKKLAVIDINGVSKTYKQGDLLADDLILVNITAKDIDVLNTSKKKHRKYLME